MKTVIEFAGKQFLVGEGDLIKVNKKIEKDTKINLEKVLAFFDEKEFKVGKPELNIKVQLQSVETKKSKKIKVLKYKPKKGYRKVNNHRQDISILKVLKISK